MALITTGKAAKIAHCTRETIQNYLRSGKLTGVRTPGGWWRVEEDHVKEKLCRATLEQVLG